MKKRKAVLVLLAVTLVSVMIFGLTACIEIGMKKNNIINTLNDAGAPPSSLRTAPMINGESGLTFEDILYSTMTVSDDVDGEQMEIEACLYVLFAANEYTAEKAEELCKSYIQDNPDSAQKWSVYRRNRVILCGHFKMVAIVRGY